MVRVAGSGIIHIITSFTLNILSPEKNRYFKKNYSENRYFDLPLFLMFTQQIFNDNDNEDEVNMIFTY